MEKKGIAYARYIKQERARLKKSLKSGEVTLKEVVLENKIPEDVLNMRIIDIIRSLPNIGRVNAEKIMVDLKINTKKRLMGLGKVQKKRFYDYFDLNEKQ